MHALVHDAYWTVLISTFCGDALSIALCSSSRSRLRSRSRSRSRSRLGHPGRSIDSFSGLHCMWDVQAEVRTQISVSVS